MIYKITTPLFGGRSHATDGVIDQMFFHDYNTVTYITHTDRKKEYTRPIFSDHHDDKNVAVYNVKGISRPCPAIALKDSSCYLLGTLFSALQETNILLESRYVPIISEAEQFTKGKRTKLCDNVYMLYYKRQPYILCDSSPPSQINEPDHTVDSHRLSQEVNEKKLSADSDDVTSIGYADASFDDRYTRPLEIAQLIDGSRKTKAAQSISNAYHLVMSTVKYTAGMEWNTFYAMGRISHSAHSQFQTLFSQVTETLCKRPLLHMRKGLSIRRFLRNERDKCHRFMDVTTPYYPLFIPQIIPTGNVSLLDMLDEWLNTICLPIEIHFALMIHALTTIEMLMRNNRFANTMSYGMYIASVADGWLRTLNKDCLFSFLPPLAHFTLLRDIRNLVESLESLTGCFVVQCSHTTFNFSNIDDIRLIVNADGTVSLTSVDMRHQRQSPHAITMVYNGTYKQSDSNAKSINKHPITRTMTHQSHILGESDAMDAILQHICTLCNTSFSKLENEIAMKLWMGTIAYEEELSTMSLSQSNITNIQKLISHKSPFENCPEFLELAENPDAIITLFSTTQQE